MFYSKICGLSLPGLESYSIVRDPFWTICLGSFPLIHITYVYGFQNEPSIYVLTFYRMGRNYINVPLLARIGQGMG